MNDRLQTDWPSEYLREAQHDYRVSKQDDGDGGPGLTGIATLEAMRRHWRVVLVTVVVMVAAGIAIGLVRKPVYTAEGRLSVQVASPFPSAVPGSIVASSGLASIYSRAIYAPAVINQVAEQTSLSPRQVMDRVSATQVPETGVVKVKATGESERSTIVLANETTEQLRRYVGNDLSGSSPQSGLVFRRYRKAASQYQNRLEQLQQLESSGASGQALREAQVNVQAAAVQRDGLAQAYQSGQQLYTAPLEVIGQATDASSDRGSRVQLFALIGLLAGLAVGAVLATVQANSEARRRPA